MTFIANCPPSVNILDGASCGAPATPLSPGFSVCVPGEGGTPSLPCLSINNSIEENEHFSEESLQSALSTVLSPYWKKSAHTLYMNVDRLVTMAPSLGHVGFLTLTFPDNVTDDKEAYSRFRSMNTNFLSDSEDFGHWICVKELQCRGAWHYHLLIHTTQDIREGFDFDEYASYMRQIKRDTSRSERRKLSQLATRSANPELRRVWSVLRRAMTKYGFGRSELLPIRTNKEFIARYIGKYISKGMGRRTAQTKGVRIVSYSRGWSKNSPKYQWNTEGAKEWRRKIALFALVNGYEDFSAIHEDLGPFWAYHCSVIFDRQQIAKELHHG